MKCISKQLQEQINRLRIEIDRAEAIIVGAGAGLSTSAGFEYFGKRFEDNFADFANKYKFRDMYSGGFYPFDTLEEYWAYWSRYIFINRYQSPPKDVYGKLYQLLKDKNYFVLTTNVDHCFQKANFDRQRLFYTQGDYGLFQCSVPCHNKTYNNESAVREMIKRQKDMKIPTEIIPRCPICGEPMTVNLRADGRFVEDDGWRRASERWEEFSEKYRFKKTLYLELGVGNNTPSIIKYRFWAMTIQNPKSVYCCINFNQAVCPQQIKDRAICINEDIGNVLQIMV